MKIYNSKKTHKKWSRPTIIAIVLLLVLLIAFGIILAVFLNQNKDEKQLYTDEKIAFYVQSDLLGEFTFSHLCTLTLYKDFEAIYDTSKSDPVKKTYSGIELAPLLLALNINLDDKTTIRLTGKDGASKAYSISDILQENNVFIANKVNGEYFNAGIDPLRSNKNNEDGGPFVVIRSSDAFSQNRMKLLVKVEVL